MKRPAGKETQIVISTDDARITILHELDAPARRVWRALTTPDLMVQWWGTYDVTNESCDNDLRNDGNWRIEQCSSDGKRYVFCGKYLDVDPPTYLSYTVQMNEFSERPILESVDLAEVKGRTRMTNTIRYLSMDDRDAMLEQGLERGARESMERLDALLATMN